MEKCCSHCNKIQDINLFNKDKNRPGGRSSWCRNCTTKWSRENYKKNSSKLLKASKLWRLRNPLNRLSNKLKAYNLTLAQYEDMRERQAYCCAVCGIPEAALHNRLSVDHCHVTGRVRSLLCSNCNTAFGLLKENNRIIKYLLEYGLANSELADSTNIKVG